MKLEALLDGDSSTKLIALAFVAQVYEGTGASCSAVLRDAAEYEKFITNEKGDQDVH